jgi:hypothetical protein
MKSIKTIFVTLTTGMQIRDFLLGDFYTLAKAREDVRLVVFIPQEDTEHYRQFAHKRCLIEPMPRIVLDWTPKKLFRGVCHRCIPTSTVWSRNWFSYLRGESLGRFVAKQCFWMLGHLRVWRALIRWMEYNIFRDDRVWKSYFDTYKPDAVFGSGILAEADCLLIKYAQRNGIPTAGMATSWDNFTSKCFLRVYPDILLVQNASMVEEAVQMNSYARERVRVVGFPQWDHYLDTAWHMSKEEFAQQFDLDPTQRWIVYFGGGLLSGLFHLPEPGDHVVMINRAIERGEIQGACTIIRPNPARIDSLSQEARNSPILTFGKGWQFFYDDIKFLLNLVRLSDVTINLGSTMALEASIFNKPIILIGFTGFQDEATLPWHHRLAVALDSTLHYCQIQDTGGVWRVADEKELIRAVQEYLAQPHLHAEGRENLQKRFVGPCDGKAGERIFHALLSLMSHQEVRTNGTS